MAKAAAAPAKKAPTKTEVFNAIAEETGLTKKQVGEVLDALAGEIRKSLAKRGAGMFTIPGLVKLTRKDVPAKPARMVRNPATGEMMQAKPKPASVTVRVRALKALKDMV